MTIVLSFAKERKTFIDFCKSRSKNIQEHIVKCILEGEKSIYLEHHLKEIINWLTEIIEIRDKYWDTMKNPTMFFIQHLGSDDDILDILDDLSYADERLQSREMEKTLCILDAVIEKFLSKRKVPDANWFKKKLKPVWKLLED